MAASLFFQKTYLTIFLAFLPQTMQQRNSGQMCNIKEITNLTKMLVYTVSEKLYKREKHLNYTLLEL